MATTTLDYDEAKKQLREAYRNKTIDYTQYRQSIDVINQKQNLGEPVEIEVEDVEIELEKPMSEMIGALRRPEEPVEIEEPEELTAPAISLMRDREEVVAPRVERIMPYRFGEKADPLSARNKYINTMEQVYQITYGNSPEEAKRKARADADKYMKGTTSEFYDAPQFHKFL